MIPCTMANSPTKKPAAKPRPAKVEVTVDRALARRWKALSAEMVAAKRRESGGFDAYWETVGEILDHDPPLYLAGGCATAREFLAKHVGESERTARRMVRVARVASPNDESRYGVSKLDAALTLLEAQGVELGRGRLPVDFARVRVDVKRDGKAERVALADATVEEVRTAARALQRKARKVAPKASPVVRAIGSALAKVPALRAVSVHHAHETVTVKGIPTGAWKDFVKALRVVVMPKA